MMKVKIKNALETAKTIAIFGHEYIDGDALGSMFALGKVLEKQGKQIKYFTPYPPSQIFDFLELGNQLQYEFDYGNYDLLIFVDFNQYSRIGIFTFGHEEYFDTVQKIIIDHHEAEQAPLNTLMYRDVNAISTCSVLYDLLREWPDCINAEIATFLYMGIATDSGNFRYDEGQQSIHVFTAVAELLKLGANKKLIIDEIFRSKSYRSVVFMKTVLQRMQRVKFSPNNDPKDGLAMIYSYYEDKELEEYAIDHDQADYALNIMQDIRNNNLVVLIKKVAGLYIKASLRGRGRVDCAKLARYFGGGGHHNAAGFRIQGSGFFQKDIQDIMMRIQQFLEEKSDELLD